MKYFLILAFMLTGACTGGTHIDYLKMRDIEAPTAKRFAHCYSYGCTERAMVALPKNTQEKIQALFTPQAKTEEEEKSKIIEALKILEADIGDIVGTKNDKRGTFRVYQDTSAESKSFQQDCIDESTNTTTYLTLLNNKGYLKFYAPAFPANRHPFLGGGNWWHQTATIQDVQTKNRYAVDTWFEDNGEAGYIVPLKEWKEGWKPQRNKVREINHSQ